MLISDGHHVLYGNDSSRHASEPSRGGHWRENALVMPLTLMLEARAPHYEEGPGDDDAKAGAVDEKLAVSL